MPLSSWLRTDLQGWARDILLDPRTRERGYFEPAAVRGLLDRHAAGADGDAKRIYSLLMLELWHREFVDAPGAGCRPRHDRAEVRSRSATVGLSVEPRILIISPVRNEAAHIERVVRAVAAQELPPARWIVVDDRSDDGTLEILRRLEPEVPFLDGHRGAGALPRGRCATGSRAPPRRARSTSASPPPATGASTRT